MSRRELLRGLNKKLNNSDKKFLTFRMWLSILVSFTTRDRGTIPENIGNNILITNNTYITKNYISSMIQILELSLDTPITFLGEMLVNEFRKEGCKAVVDFTVKNKKKIVDLNEAGLKARIELWEKSENNNNLSARDKRRALRLLYTVDQIRKGQNVMDSRIFLTIRAKDGEVLSQAEKITYKYLSKIGCLFKPIVFSLNDYLEYTSLLSDRRTKKIKSMHAIVNSNKTLSQMLPNTHSPGNNKGVYLGINTINNTPFKLDFKNITYARNIYCVTGSGGGKTALVLNMLASALEDGFNGCIMDIKGNEFTSVVDAVDGATISLRESSNEYINTFRMLKDETTDDKAEIYFKERFNFSKKQMILLSGITDINLTMKLEGFVDEFLNYLYTAIGVRADNRNTWENTDKLNPYVVYEYMERFLNEPIKEKYKDIISYIVTNLRMYFSRDGSKSYIFTNELQYKDLLTRRAIRFDFGLLAGTTYDATIFRLKFEYMSRINAEYVTMNFDRGIHTFKVLEESQAVSEDVLESYAREYTLRRAQLQTTLLLGNSVDALVRNPKAMPIIETTTALLIGKLNKATADLVIKYFDVGNREGIIRYMSSSNRYLRHFLFINNMEDRALSPIIKVQYDPNIKYKILTPTRVNDI